VLLSNLFLGLLYWLWQPITGIVWIVENQAAVVVLLGLYAIGWVIVIYSSFLVDHFDLFGLRQVFLHWRGQASANSDYRELGTLYRLVRHPLMLGFVIAFWATPQMTVGHLLFAIVTTAYILVALKFEERDLVAEFGDNYRAYQSRVPMLIPFAKITKGAEMPSTKDTVGED
jgi:protein-S-isoprenylcysteine O-methyltransferase Ste14